MKKAKIKTPDGVGFYTLRRTAATMTAKSRDPFAVQRLLGHANLKPATRYVQDVSKKPKSQFAVRFTSFLPYQCFTLAVLPAKKLSHVLTGGAYGHVE